MNTHDDLNDLIAQTIERIRPLEHADLTRLDRAAAPSAHQPPSEARIAAMSDPDLARYIDHTLLRVVAGRDAHAELCRTGIAMRCATVCVFPCWTAFCKSELEGSGIRLASVVGFPLGTSTGSTKLNEAVELIELGADELDMVANLALLRAEDDQAFFNDVFGVVRAAAAGGIAVKVILETPLLTREEIVRGCLLCLAAGAEFVKTCSGFQGGGATVEDVRLMRRVVGNAMGVKASGGIRDAATARAMLAAGANRIGTSSALAIVGQK